MGLEEFASQREIRYGVCMQEVMNETWIVEKFLRCFRIEEDLDLCFYISESIECKVACLSHRSFKQDIWSKCMQEPGAPTFQTNKNGRKSFSTI